MDILTAFWADLSTWLWGWPMIIMLLGTHLFLTIRLRVPQRKIWTAIRLSVTTDQAGQRRRQPVRRIGHFAGCDHRYRKYHRRGDCCFAGRAGCCAVVLAHRCAGHLDQVCRMAVGHKVPREEARRRDAGRAHVCLGTGIEHAVAGHTVLCVYGHSRFWYRQYGAGQLHLAAGAGDLRRFTPHYRGGCRPAGGSCYRVWRERHCPCVHGAGPLHGTVLCLGLCVYIVAECGLSGRIVAADCRLGFQLPMRRVAVLPGRQS